ncbi:hypothetical protein Tco_0821129 [Tanacetum coccineum]|uniref:Uncharacterized protein n=1 Tax=Tanacetum coccineum TaxID=301880 RepID=A0ABQ5ABE6_9ASTR
MKINVTRPNTTRPDLRKRHPYTPYKDPQGFIYVDDFERNRLMRTDELYKFNDGTLNRLLTSLNDITNNINMEYLPKKRWSNLKKKRAHYMIKDINKLLKERRMMRSLDRFVGEHAEYDESNTYVLERFNTTAGNPVKEILLKLNLPDHMSILTDLKAQVQFDQALRASLEKVVTASGPGFGDWQWRLATLLIKLGGLGILSAGDIIRYAFLASRLQTSALQDKILMKTGIDSHGYSFQHAFDAFNTTCNVDVLSYSLSPRQVAILISCIRAPHAQDFLFTIPIDGLEQRMNHRQFRSMLCYRLVVPMFSEVNGLKFRHNVRDILVDICSKVGIMVRKEAPMGFLSEDGKDLRPADLLLFNWL